jgi:DNA repair exonuclease SbcCD ATPase subunit
MVEQIMFVGIGFLVAGLLVIGVIPMVHARAVRLTMRRIEALTPLSMTEIQAEKDQLRAEFAMSTRRLEMSVEQLKAKTANQLTELGKKSEAIGRLKLELGEKTAQLMALEAKERQLADDVLHSQSDLTARIKMLNETETALTEAQARLTFITDQYNEHAMTADSHRIDLVTLRAQCEVLNGQVESYEKETRSLQERLELKTAEAENASRQLAEEQARAEQLSTKVGDLDRPHIAQTTEAEILGRRVQELSARLDEQSRLLADREYAGDRLRSEATSAHEIEAQLRAELAETENRHRLATEGLRVEKASIEEQLRHSEEERTRLQRDIAAMKLDAENVWTNERMENAVLRERINDVAAEVARLTAALEGPGSPIDAIVAEAPPAAAAANGSGDKAVPSIAPNGGESKGTLADRIRALQSRASARVQQAG